MADIKVVPLGAGQDVGRSCILVSIGGKNIMLDCGMHMGYNDAKRFPDFSYITKRGNLNKQLDAVIITHFHLDHCGALPYMSEMVGYDGPIYMTHPTKAICPILLEDYRKITVDRKGETNFFTSEMIKNCMKKVVVVGLHETIYVDEDLELKAYYAGHVLGAAMFSIKVGQQSVVYTGDYNMTPDRHLGAAWIDRCHPDLLITESTYAATVRDSKRCREGDFLKKVHDCVDRGGKVLIPVFALGRAQELCILLETYWERMNLKVPIYFTMGLTGKANQYYKLFISWTNQKIKSTFVQRNMFEFNHISPFDNSLIDKPGPMVVFATPGMLHGGMSLQIFKKWCSNENNMIIMPGYCVAGTIGNKVLSGKKKIEFENKQVVEVNMKVEHLSFSAHADAKGIIQLIRMAVPRCVMLVHGEKAKMSFLAEKIRKQFNVKCLFPANGETCHISAEHPLPLDIKKCLIKSADELASVSDSPMLKKAKLMKGVIVIENEKMELMNPTEALSRLGLKQHNLRFTCKVFFKEDFSGSDGIKSTLQYIHDAYLKKFESEQEVLKLIPDEYLSIGETVVVKVTDVSGDNTEADKEVKVVWSLQDEYIGCELIQIIKHGIKEFKKVKMN